MDHEQPTKVLLVAFTDDAAAAGYVIPKAGVGLMTGPRAANYLAGANPGLIRNALALPSRAGTGALVRAYLLSQQ